MLFVLAYSEYFQPSNGPFYSSDERFDFNLDFLRESFLGRWFFEENVPKTLIIHVSLVL